MIVCCARRGNAAPISKAVLDAARARRRRRRHDVKAFLASAEKLVCPLMRFRPGDLAVGLLRSGRMGASVWTPASRVAPWAMGPRRLEMTQFLVGTHVGDGLGWGDRRCGTRRRRDQL